MPAITKKQAVKKLKKQFSRKAVIKRLDDIFSLYVRARDKNICFVCGKRPPEVVMQCGHLITRGSHSTRWDDANAHAQCRGCNFSHEHRPEHYTTAYINKWGLAAYENLVFKSKQPSKLKTADLELLIIHYKQKLEELQ